MDGKTLLIAVATPLGLPPTRGTLELRKIKEAHGRRPGARIEVLESMTIDGLRRALLSLSPHTVQLITHADGHALSFESELGGPHAVAYEHIAAVLLAHRPALREVVVSACHTAPLAALLARGGVDAVGFCGRASAAAAVHFSHGLHDALAARRSLAFAVGEGLRTVAVHGHELRIEHCEPTTTMTKGGGVRKLAP